jgi:hypothetical protein
VKPIVAPDVAHEIAASASAFAAALRPEFREQLQFTFNDPERKDWSNLPHMVHPRKGVRLGALSDAERRAAQSLIQTMLSGQGYLKALGIMQHDDVFNDINLAASPAAAQPAPAGGGNPADGPRFSPEVLAAARKLGAGGGNFGSGLFFLDVFGKVGGRDPWGVQLDGHHLAVNVTVVDNQEVTITPAFFGSEPALIPQGPMAGWELFGPETRLALDLRNSLTPQQTKKAVLSGEMPADLFTGPGRHLQLETMQGVSGLEGRQQDLLESLIEEYVGSAPPRVARGYRESIRNAGFDKIHFSWMGPADATQQFYFRLHGPAVLIEFERLPALRKVASAPPANHIHSLLRIPGNDYGQDWMRQHHIEYDHQYHY